MKRILVSLLLITATSFADAGSRRTDEGVREIVRRGIEAMKQGDFETALARFRDAQIEEPDAPEIHLNVGLALYRLGRFAEAETSFRSASLAREQSIEKAASLHLGNALVKQGRYDAARAEYERALQIDADYEDARVNLEWVIRKQKELAAKQKEKSEQQKKEREIIEKLEDLVKRQLEVHGQTRSVMLAVGEPVQETTIARLRGVLPAALPDGAEVKTLTDEERATVFSTLSTAQTGIRDDLRALLEETRAKAASSSAPTADPDAPPTPKDPEIAKLERALPHLSAAEPSMDHAIASSSAPGDFAAVHAGQQAALAALFKALDELLDELSRLIQGQAALMRDTFDLEAAAGIEDETLRPSADVVRDKAVVQSQAQQGIEDRTVAFARGLEGALDAARAEIENKPNGAGGVEPGSDEQLQKVASYQAALGHVNEAAARMKDAGDRLAELSIPEAYAQEGRALAALIEAKKVLSPPQQGQGEGDEKNDQQQEEKGEEDGKQDQQGGEKPPEQDSSKPQPKPADQPELSEEQAQKMLEQAAQREKDRREADRDRQRRAGRGVGRGRDW